MKVWGYDCENVWMYDCVNMWMYEWKYINV